MNAIRCPKCGKGLLQKSQDGKTRLRVKTAFWKDEECFGVCKSCNTEVSIPLILGTKKAAKEPLLVVLEKSKKKD